MSRHEVDRLKAFDEIALALFLLSPDDADQDRLAFTNSTARSSVVNRLGAFNGILLRLFPLCSPALSP